jgi:hypothetical protein
LAVVKEIIWRQQDQTRIHPTQVECSYLSFESRIGPILQLTTYGSDARDFPGKASQTIQFDLRTARRLREILDEVFGSRVQG